MPLCWHDEFVVNFENGPHFCAAGYGFRSGNRGMGCRSISGSKSEEPDSFDVEPPILKQNLSDEPLPNGDLARLEKQLERAKQNAAGAERLYKIGVLAKVEVEQRLLKVIRCESELANARVARAKDELAEKESQLATGEITRDELESIKTALAQLTEAAQAATTKSEPD